MSIGRTRVARRGLAADDRLEIGKVDELVGLAAQLIGDHGRARLQHGDDADAFAPELQVGDEAAEVAVAGEQHDVIERRRELDCLHRELDVHVALDLAATGGVGELLERLGHDGEAVVAEPVDQRTDRRIFLIVGKCCIVERAHGLSPLPEQHKQSLVVDANSSDFAVA